MGEVERGYEIIESLEVEPHIRFFRIRPTDIKLTLRSVFESLSNNSWIMKFDNGFLKHTFSVRFQSTIDYISSNIIHEEDDSLTSDSAEYVISEIARSTIVEQLDYLDIPLGELIKEQKSGNPGFDFYSMNKSDIILFGEAKYVAKQNAYGRALEQIYRFHTEQRDVADLLDIQNLCPKTSCDEVCNGNKGFIAAFSSKSTPTERLIGNIKNNNNYQNLSSHKELILVAVDICQ
ncbi:hypothetical protein [Hoylesella timonensis]|uniref:hypothetical protein n=1 Tax=Hoylesella timonensis TaxID=386414 RepID=UPI00242B1F28|nr:hypothetical protein [Hoylesella timonensis]